MATIGIHNKGMETLHGKKKPYHAAGIDSISQSVIDKHQSDNSKHDGTSIQSFMSDAMTPIMSMIEFAWEKNARDIKSVIVSSAIDSIEDGYKEMRYVMQAALVQRIGIEPTMYSIATVASDDKEYMLRIMDKYIEADLSMMNAIYNMDREGTGSGSSMAFGFVYDTQNDDVIDSRAFATGGYTLGTKSNRKYLIDFTQPSSYATQEGDIIGMESLSFRLDDTSRANSVLESFIDDAADRPTIITCAETSDKFGGLMGIDKVVTIDADGHSVIQNYNGMLPFHCEPSFIC